MSMPNIPKVDHKIDLKTEEAANVVLASIGFEELGLSHIINAEGEKIQAFLGTLKCQEPTKMVTIEDLERLDAIVNKTLNKVIEEEFLLLLKLEEIDEVLKKERHRKT